MRISINAKRIDGPFGGGNQFLNYLEDCLKIKGHYVTRELESDLDVILLAIAENNLAISNYDTDCIGYYKKLNPNVQVVQRINSIDEARGTKNKTNNATLNALKIADAVVYISQYIANYFHNITQDRVPSFVIRNGADPALYHPDLNNDWNGIGPLKIVTHHWSDNIMKGFDFYERLDYLLETERFASKFSFTIIGNVPRGFSFKNTQIIPPLKGNDLAILLRQHHVYLTAARNEAAGMHHIEGMLSGLPVLYLESGALPEYCHDFGLSFNPANFEEKILQILSSYSELRHRMNRVPWKAGNSAEQYELLFQNMCASAKKNKISLVARVAIYALILLTPAYKIARKIKHRLC